MSRPTRLVLSLLLLLAGIGAFGVSAAGAGAQTCAQTNTCR